MNEEATSPSVRLVLPRFSWTALRLAGGFGLRRGTRYAYPGLRCQKIEIAALVGLRHRFEKELAVAAGIFVARGRLLPLAAARFQLRVPHQQFQRARRHVEPDAVAVPDQGKIGRASWRERV